MELSPSFGTGVLPCDTTGRKRHLVAQHGPDHNGVFLVSGPFYGHIIRSHPGSRQMLTGMSLNHHRKWRATGSAACVATGSPAGPWPDDPGDDPSTVGIHRPSLPKQPEYLSSDNCLYKTITHDPAANRPERWHCAMIRSSPSTHWPTFLCLHGSIRCAINPPTLRGARKGLVTGNLG